MYTLNSKNAFQIQILLGAIVFLSPSIFFNVSHGLVLALKAGKEYSILANGYRLILFATPIIFVGAALGGLVTLLIFGKQFFEANAKSEKLEKEADGLRKSCSDSYSKYQSELRGLSHQQIKLNEKAEELKRRSLDLSREDADLARRRKDLANQAAQLKESQTQHRKRKKSGRNIQGGSYDN